MHKKISHMLTVTEYFERSDPEAASEIVTGDYLRKHPDLQWCMGGLSKNVTNDIIEAVIIDQIHLPNATGQWSWEYASYNATDDTIIKYNTLPWNRALLSVNEMIDHDLIISLDKEGYFPNITGEWNMDDVARMKSYKT